MIAILEGGSGSAYAAIAGVLIVLYWIVRFLKNDIGFLQRKSSGDQQKHSRVKILKGDGSDQTSLADEIAKWGKLKEDGHISEKEFEKVKNKLLNQ